MLAESPDFPTSIAFLVVIATATVILMLALRRRSNSQSRSTTLTGVGASRSVQSSRQASDEMRQLLIELQEFARQAVGQIDTRSRKLEVLIRDADARLERLGQAQASPPTAKQGAADSDEPDRPTSSLDILVGDAGPTHRVTDRHASDSKISGERLTVFELADQGLSSIEIAKKLNRPTGEIELILSLRAQSTESQAAG